MESEVSFLAPINQTNINASNAPPTYSENSIVSRIVTEYMDKYLVPLLVLIGLTGNMISFIVFVATYMRRLSSSVYLAALSFADMIFLVCLFFDWAKHIDVHLKERNGWCQAIFCLNYMSSFLSVWYIVSFTVERYIAVYFPLRRYDFCTPARAKAVVLSLALFASIFYCFGAWTAGISVIQGMPICNPIRYSEMVDILNNVDTVITLILPFVAILAMNARIAYKVVQFYRARREMGSTLLPEPETSTSGNRVYRHRTYSAGLRITVASTGPGTVNQRNGYFRNQVRVTKMLLTVSTVFLVLNLPRHTIRTYMFISGLSRQIYVPAHSLTVWQKAFHFLYYIHFCVNVFLYSAMGSNFRKALVSLLKRMKRCVCEHVSTLIYACCGLTNSRGELNTTTAMMARMSPSPGAVPHRHLLLRAHKKAAQDAVYL